MSKPANRKVILAVARTTFILGLFLVMLAILSMLVPPILGDPLDHLV